MASSRAMKHAGQARGRGHACSPHGATPRCHPLQGSRRCCPRDRLNASKQREPFCPTKGNTHPKVRPARGSHPAAGPVALWDSPPLLCLLLAGPPRRACLAPGLHKSAPSQQDSEQQKCQDYLRMTAPAPAPRGSPAPADTGACVRTAGGSRDPGVHLEPWTNKRRSAQGTPRRGSTAFT